MLAMNKRAILKERYMKMFECMLESAFNNRPQPVLLADGLCIELYLEEDELHWRRSGRDTGRSTDEDDPNTGD